jgi:uncharacterized protein
VAAAIAGFADVLHRAGVPVSPERGARLAAAIMLARPATTAELYWLARTTLISARADIDVFDRVFRRVFEGEWDPADFRGDPNTAIPPRTRRDTADTTVAVDDRSVRPSAAPSASQLTEHDGTESATKDDSAESVLTAMSNVERLRQQSFAAMTAEELAHLRALMARLALAPPRRRSRRTVRHPRGPTLDMRATVRRSLRSGGDPVTLVRRRRRDRPRRLVVLCDISGSMEPYARAYLQLLHSAVGGANAEAFVFATRLTRVTKLLRQTNPDYSLHRAGIAAPDWSGGTRIGVAVKTFNDRFGRGGMARNAVVVIVSDGWERDDPSLLGVEMERLARLAHRVIWVNPRKAGARFEPTVAGMAAALPHVDAFISGHTLAALDELLVEIATP